MNANQRSAGGWVTPEGWIRTGDVRTDREAASIIAREVAERFERAVAEWAARDDGALITPRGVRLEVAVELSTVLEALGPWARVRGDLLFDGVNPFDSGP
ncbi:hypothetical protein [Demequina rhizosphaerae]|uniref:hypothetical protein n=1 Tax=Demequina rhizosphaerae TaxID=1638985 RepID=UPI0007808788|nr:hypothetical protein [Demequina rhizosphaerae]